MCFLTFVLGLLLGVMAVVIVVYLIGRAGNTREPPAPNPERASAYESMFDVDDLSDEYLHNLQEAIQQLLTKGERKR